MSLIKKHRRCFGLTLVELAVGVTITAILSVAVGSIVTAGVNTTTYVNHALDADSQIEFACRRIIENVRTAGSIVTPSSTTAATSLSIVTLPDASNTNYTVTYTVSNGILYENDPRYNSAPNTPNVIAKNVTAFSLARVSNSSPVSITMTLSIDGAAARTITMTCRN